MVATWGGRNIWSGKRRNFGYPSQGPVTRQNFYQTALDSQGRWAQDANEQYDRLQSVDENGNLAMQGPVPAGVALKWQDIHNQAIWNYRQRLMGASTGYLKGALGDLQRSRPGGASALESGAYSQVAGNLMQRAEMTQPMDLLSDYRRDAEAQNRRRTRNAQYLQLAGQLGGAAISAIGMAAGGGGAMGLGQAALMAAGNAANGYFVGQGLAQGAQVQQPGQAPQTMMGPGLGNTGQVDPSTIGQPPTSRYVMDPNAATDQSRQWGNYQAPNPSGYAPGTGQSILAPGGSMEQTLNGLRSNLERIRDGGNRYPEGSPGPGAGAPGGAPQQSTVGPGGKGPGAGGAMGMGAPSFGANGDFSPLAAAAQAASSPSPISHVTGLMVQEHMVELLEGDPDWGMLDAAYRRQALARGMAS